MAPPNPDPSALTELGAAAETAADSNLRLLNILGDLNKIAPDLYTSVKALTIAYPALAIAQTTFNSALYKTIIGGSEELAKIPRLIASEILGANVLLSEGTTTATDAMTRNTLVMQRAERQGNLRPDGRLL
jgi:hypothetical protein